MGGGGGECVELSYIRFKIFWYNGRYCGFSRAFSILCRIFIDLLKKVIRARGGNGAEVGSMAFLILIFHIVWCNIVLRMVIKSLLGNGVWGGVTKIM